MNMWCVGNMLRVLNLILENLNFISSFDHEDLWNGHYCLTFLVKGKTRDSSKEAGRLTKKFLSEHLSPRRANDNQDEAVAKTCFFASIIKRIVFWYIERVSNLNCEFAKRFSVIHSPWQFNSKFPSQMWQEFLETCPRHKNKVIIKGAN